MSGVTGALVAGKRQARRVNNLLWERRLGVVTRGVVAVDYPDASQYASIDYALIDQILRHLALQPSDVFVDVGCGKGRVLCCAARFRVRHVIGVDLSEEFCAQARANAERTRGRRSPVEVHQAFAQEYDYSDCTAFYMFSPFGPDTMEQVLTKIRKDRAGAPIRIAYSNPAFVEVFAGQDWLEQYDFWDRDARGEEHSVAFYRSK
ncbi:SAM-dependent methyltransferase [Dactylosporangium sp. NPDC048998]|uniref:SAM-dependent methyltransferase n=1 Tax=Dactylosporangium sp. NPDC048998 TaxID=3363976 RepID=UPI003722483E